MARNFNPKDDYGPAHKRERKRWINILAREGVVPCARCHQPIHHGDTWDLGHTDDRTAWTGPECVSCNRSAGGTNGARITNMKRAMKIRDW